MFEIDRQGYIKMLEIADGMMTRIAKSHVMSSADKHWLLLAARVLRADGRLESLWDAEYIKEFINRQERDHV